MSSFTSPATSPNMQPSSPARRPSLMPDSVDQLSDVSVRSRNAGLDEGVSVSPSIPVAREEPFPVISRQATDFSLNKDLQPLVIVLVGLPGRGKSYIANRIRRWLHWKGVECAIFNAGNYRREILGASQPANWFDPDNTEAQEAKEKMAQLAVQELRRHLTNKGHVAILDATNTTVERRKWVVEELADLVPINRIIFVESICNDESMLRQSTASKLGNPDYATADPEVARRDFQDRVKNYAKVYKRITLELESHLSFVQMVDIGTTLHVNRIDGALPRKIVYFLMNLSPVPFVIYLARIGQTDYDVDGRRGGFGTLTEFGARFGPALAQFMISEHCEKFDVWTSTMDTAVRTVTDLLATLQHASDVPVDVQPRYWKCLDEMSYGQCEGLSEQELRRDWIKTYTAWQQDRYHVSWVHGESFRHVCERLEPVILESEHNPNPVLIVAHPTVCTALDAYMRQRPAEDGAKYSFPLHTVVKFEFQSLHPQATSFSLESLMRDDQ